MPSEAERIAALRRRLGHPNMTVAQLAAIHPGAALPSEPAGAGMSPAMYAATYGAGVAPQIPEEILALYRAQAPDLKPPPTLATAVAARATPRRVRPKPRQGPRQGGIGRYNARHRHGELLRRLR